MRFCLLMLAAAVLVPCAGAESDENTYDNPGIGISVTKPADWHFGTVEDHRDNLRRMTYRDEEMGEYVREESTAPLVYMMKYPEPYDDLNPTFKVGIRPLGTIPNDQPTAVLTVLLAGFRRTLNELTVQAGPKDTTIDGLPAGYLRIHYDLVTTDSAVCSACSEVWIVPRDSCLLMIGAGTKQDDADSAREEIATILGSLRIKK